MNDSARHRQMLMLGLARPVPGESPAAFVDRLLDKAKRQPPVAADSHRVRRDFDSEPMRRWRERHDVDAARHRVMLGFSSRQDGEVRAAPAVDDVLSYRRPTASGDSGTLTGYAAVYRSWTTIDSSTEGLFREQFLPNVFSRSIAERGPDGIPILLEHGKDPTLANKPIARPTVLRETPDGLYVEAPLFRVPDVLADGLAAGLYGASVRFKVRDDSWVDRPGVSDHNREGLPERSVVDADLLECGPTVWPAYPTTSMAVGD